MTTNDKLLAEVRHDGQVLHLQLNSPKANILDIEMVRSIMAALETHVTAGTKAVVFEGPASTSLGASVEEHTKDKVGTMLPEFHGMFRRLSQLSIPTFAVVRGQCLGGGMELASYCSWIFASPNAHFGQPEINLAVFAPVASVLLPWRLGASAAMDLCVSGRSVTAEEAHRLGLVHAVTGRSCSRLHRIHRARAAGQKCLVTSLCRTRGSPRAIRSS